VQQRLSTALLRSSQLLAGQAINVGQNTVDFIVSLFVMLYLLFFLLRDGDQLTGRIEEAVPLRPERRTRRARHAAGDTRATRLKARLKAASDS